MKKLFFSLLAAACALTANAQLTDGTEYLFKNVETGYYLAGGNDWGTHVSMMNKPQFFKAEQQSEGVYKLDSHQYNNETSHYLNTGYLDNGGCTWTLEDAGEGAYYLKSAENTYITGHVKNAVVDYNATTSEASKWLVVTKADIVASQDAAGLTTPVDVTPLILNPSLKRNANTNFYPTWTVTGFDGTGKPSNYSAGQNANVANCSESYHSSNGFKVAQTVSGLKAGVYRFDAQAFYRQDGSDNDNKFTITVNGKSVEAPLKTGSENSMAAAYTSFLAEKYPIESIYVSVEEGGDLTISFQNANTEMWNIFGECGLTYYGDCTVEEAKNVAIVLDWQAYIPTIDAKAATLDAAGQAKYAELKALIATPTSYEALTAAKAALDAAYIAGVKAQTTMGADFTAAIVNPNFDGNINGWTDSFSGSLNHGYQDNNTYGTINQFMECWAGQWSGATAPYLLPNGKLSQVITNLPAGTYTLTADAIATQQQAGQEGYIADLAEATGIYLFAGDTRSVALNVTGGATSHAVSMYFTIPETQDVEIGLVIENTNCNWAVLDNVKLFKGARVDMAVNAEAKWSTFCAPFEVAVPAGATAYTVDGVKDNVLEITQVSTIGANTPVVVNAEAGVTTITSWGDIQSGSTTCGLLTGVYETTAITSGYVLQNHDGVVGFYKVVSVNNVPANHAYLTVPAATEARFFGLGGETAINAIDALTTGKAQIFDLNGRKLNSLQKGINIVNGVKILVK